MVDHFRVVVAGGNCSFSSRSLSQNHLEQPLMSESETMSLAERIGRIVLFPLSMIDRAATKRRAEVQKLQEMQCKQEQLRIDAEQCEKERQKIAQESAERDRAEAERSMHLSRGEKARYSSQLLYDRHEYQIREKFPQEKLERYFDEYMNDEFPVELIEKRGQDLKAMIESFVEGDKPKQSSPDAVKQYFDEQRIHLNSMDLAPDVLEAQLLELNYRQDQAIKEHLRNL